MKKNIFFCLVLLITTFKISAQDYYWWINNVNWDHKKSWSDYIIYSSKYMGPNALPVPNFSDGLIENETNIRFSACSHFSPGDNTYNPMVYVNYNLVKNLISFDLNYIPIEYFKMSLAVKTERKTFFYFYDRKTAHGDTYLNTNIQILKRQLFNLKLRVGYKFPTSSLIGLARYTDKPGYYFDLNFGKKYLLANELQFSINGMLGFYVWETNSDFQFQNDAPLYGLGVSLKKKQKFAIETGVRGYRGYLNNGDRPIVWKTNFSRRINKFDLSLSYQLGLHDTKYQSMELGIGYLFNKFDIKKNPEKL